MGIRPVRVQLILSIDEAGKRGFREISDRKHSRLMIISSFKLGLFETLVADDRGNAESGEEVGGVFVLRCDVAEVPRSAKHALDCLALAIEEGRQTALPFHCNCAFGTPICN